MHNAKALAVALCPLKVVQQAPDVVAANVCALRYGFGQFFQMQLQVAAAHLVVARALDHRRVVGGAVFGNPDRRQRPFLAQILNHAFESFRIDLPAQIGQAFAGRRRHEAVAARGVLGGARRLGERARVVVKADEIERLRADFRVACPTVGAARTHLRQQLRRPFPAKQGIEETLVAFVFGHACRVHVGRVGAGRIAQLGIKHDAHRRVGVLAAPGLNPQAMRQQQVVRRNERRLAIVHAGCKHAEIVAEEGRAPGLIQRRHARQAVAQMLRHQMGVVSKAVGGIALQPAAVQVRGQVPVKQRGVGRDAVLIEHVEQAFVEVEAGAVERVVFADHARPGNREAIVLETKPGQQADVGFVAMDVVAGDQAVAAIPDAIGLRAEVIPDARQPVIGAPLDLKRRCGTSPLKVLRQQVGRQYLHDLTPEDHRFTRF